MSGQPHALVPLSPGEETPYPLNKRLGWPIADVGVLEETVSLSFIDTRLQYPGSSKQTVMLHFHAQKTKEKPFLDDSFKNSS
jgi:hypothetical protein